MPSAIFESNPYTPCECCGGGSSRFAWTPILLWFGFVMDDVDTEEEDLDLVVIGDADAAAARSSDWSESLRSWKEVDKESDNVKEESSRLIESFSSLLWLWLPFLLLLILLLLLLGVLVVVVALPLLLKGELWPEGELKE